MRWGCYEAHFTDGETQAQRLKSHVQDYTAGERLSHNLNLCQVLMVTLLPIYGNRIKTNIYWGLLWAKHCLSPCLTETL